MFGVDESGHAAQFLAVGHDMQCQRGFAGCLRTVDLNDSAARQTADTECGVQCQRTGWNDFNLGHRHAFAKAHDRALAVLAFNLPECCL